MFCSFVVLRFSDNEQVGASFDMPFDHLCMSSLEKCLGLPLIFLLGFLFFIIELYELFVYFEN